MDKYHFSYITKCFLKKPGLKVPGCISPPLPSERGAREVTVELETAIRNNMINPYSTITFMIAGLDPGCVISPLALELESAIVNNIYYQLGHMRGKQNLVKWMWNLDSKTMP